MKKCFSLLSLDTADGTGDHENDYSKNKIIYKNGSLVDADCESKAVRIRNIIEHTFWPNIPRTTLLFSNIKFYNLSEIGDIDVFSDFNGSFHKAVKPKYG